VPANFKISYVVVGGEHPGAILSLKRKPREGETVLLGENEFTIVEVIPLMPPRGDFHYLHVTLEPAQN
jgi:hypothetical protein